MIKTIPFRNTELRFDYRGKGFPLVFLHGFMESLDVWDEFIEDLEENFQIIRIDLPGHGKSGLVDNVHTMDIMANAIKEVLDFLRIKKAVLIGHSMGGYVSLEFVRQYPQYVKCLILFHSTPFADVPERKEQRNQMIRDIKVGKKVRLAKDFVQKTFSDQNSDKLTKKIGFLKIIAINTANEGIIAALEGMKQRPDYSNLLKESPIPVLWILGKQDNFIPVDVYKNLNLSEKVEVKILEHSGHQGYIEEPEKSSELIKNFVNKCLD